MTHRNAKVGAAQQSMAELQEIAEAALYMKECFDAAVTQGMVAMLPNSALGLLVESRLMGGYSRLKVALGER